MEIELIKIIDDRYYTLYELAKIGAFRKIKTNGDLHFYKYSGVRNLVTKDIARDNIFQTSTKTKNNIKYHYILGRNVKEYILKNNHKFINKQI